MEFSFDPGGEWPLSLVRVSDRGPGISEAGAIFEGRYQSRTGMGLGLTGTSRLMDYFSLESTPGKGTTVTFGKFLPAAAGKLDVQQIARLSEQLDQDGSHNSIEELQQSNQELLAALNTVRAQEVELERRQTELDRLNHELEETNRRRGGSVRGA